MSIDCKSTIFYAFSNKCQERWLIFLSCLVQIRKRGHLFECRAPLSGHPQHPRDAGVPPQSQGHVLPRHRRLQMALQHRQHQLAPSLALRADRSRQDRGSGGERQDQRHGPLFRRLGSDCPADQPGHALPRSILPDADWFPGIFRLFSFLDIFREFNFINFVTKISFFAYSP